MPPAGKVSYCFFCGSQAPAGGSCASCLVTVADPYAEVAEPITVACPRCTTPLLAVGIAPGATLQACGRCHGVLVGARAWCTLLTRPDLAQALQARLPARGAPPSELVRMLRCPLCASGAEMERGRFGASSNIVIDVCTRHGVWLDGGEIAAVVQHSRFREKVGAGVARTALDRAEARANPHAEAAKATAAAIESARLVAQPRSSTARRGLLGGAGLALFLVLARVVFYVFVARSEKSPSIQVESAGESATTAATALGR